MKAKHFLLPLLAGALALASCNQTPKVPEGEFLIEGELKNVPDSVVIMLMKEEGRLLSTVAMDTVNQGKFALGGSISSIESQKYDLLCFDDGFPSMQADVWVRSVSYTKVTGKDKLLPLWKITSEVPEQQMVNEFMKLCPEERKESMRLRAQDADLIRSAEVDRNKLDSLRTLYDSLDSLIYLTELNYMKEIPVTKVWLGKLELYSSFLQWYTEFGHQKLIRSLYDRMSATDKATELGKAITGYMNLPELVDVGDDMVDGDLYDLEGKVRHLSEFKGKYILLDFWSQGCGPCFQSLSEMDFITQQYAGKMEVVSINQDSKEAWKDFVEIKD